MIVLIIQTKKKYKFHFYVEKRLAETTFHGNLGEYLGYNYMDLPNAWSLVSIRESFELSFRTKIANGLLLLTSDEYEDYLAITIRDAGLTLTMKLGSNVHEKTIKPSKVRFDDNQWHTVLVWRRIREISPSTYFCHVRLSFTKEILFDLIIYIYYILILFIK